MDGRVELPETPSDESVALQADRTAGWTDAASAKPIYLRIDVSNFGKRDSVVVTLLEFDSEGYLLREVGLDENGFAVYVTRPGEYGRWNDSLMDRFRPGTAEFEEQWIAFGATTTPISKEDFERAYAPADATLPHTVGGTPTWISDLVSWAVLLAIAAVLLAVVLAAIVIGPRVFAT